MAGRDLLQGDCRRFAFFQYKSPRGAKGNRESASRDQAKNRGSSRASPLFLERRESIFAVPGYTDVLVRKKSAQ